MNLSEAIAFCALMIGIVSVCGILLDAYKSRQKTRVKELEAQARIAEAQSARVLPDSGAVEDRLRVLERIATDRGQMVADEIEALRQQNRRDKAEA